MVAVTGDGVNDAPALRQSALGVAMGRTGTATAKESADMVLADDNFATLRAAIEEGRRVYDNLVKALAFVLPTSLGQALIIAIAVLAFPLRGGDPQLPVEPVQILWINLIVAVALALPLAFEAPEPDLMDRPPRRPGTPLLDRPLLVRTLAVAAGLTAVALGVFELEHDRHLADGVGEDLALARAQTAAVTAAVLFQAFYLLTCRSLTRPNRETRLVVEPGRLRRHSRRPRSSRSLSSSSARCRTSSARPAWTRTPSRSPSAPRCSSSRSPGSRSAGGCGASPRRRRGTLRADPGGRDGSSQRDRERHPALREPRGHDRGLRRARQPRQGAGARGDRCRDRHRRARGGAFPGRLQRALVLELPLQRRRLQPRPLAPGGRRGGPDGLGHLDVGNHHLVSGWRARLGEQLAESTGGRLTHAVFTPSGTESVDLALRLARAVTGRPGIVAAVGAYHGLSGFALAASDPRWFEPFGHGPEGFAHVPYNEIEAMRDEIDSDTAAVILEAIPATLGFPAPPPATCARSPMPRARPGRC